MGRRFSKIEENSFFLPETLLQNINFIKLSVHFMIGQYDISVSLKPNEVIGRTFLVKKTDLLQNSN